MRGKPLSGYGRIKCCMNCIAPKRHVGCHATCEEYKKEREEHDALKKKMIEQRKKAGPVMGDFAFDMLSFSTKPTKRHKHKKRKET